MQNMPIWYLFTGFVMEMLLLREYSLRFPNRRVPHSRVFASVYNKPRETGALPSSHISSERANEQYVDEVESILQSAERSPTTSTRRISPRIDVPHTRVWRTLRQHGLYPFHLQMVQRLGGGDEARRLDLCRWLIANRRLIPLILFTDEASFTRDGINNTHNSHRWSTCHCGKKFSTSLLCKCVVRCDRQSVDWVCCVAESSYGARVCRLSAK